MGLALVTRIPSLAEAHIAAGALRSAGIAAEVFDTSFGAIESPVIESLGGYRIMAPEAQAAEARQLLTDLRSNPVPREPDDVGPWAAPPAERRPLRNRGVRLIALAILGAPVLLWLLTLLVRGRD